MLVVLWEMSWRQWMDYYIVPTSPCDHSSTSSSSWLGFLNCGSLRAQSPLSEAGSHFSGILSPTNSNSPRYLVILLSHAHLLPLFFRLFIQVHLLIDGSVEGQYITLPESGHNIIFIFSSRHKLHLPSKQLGVVDLFNILHWISAGEESRNVFELTLYIWDNTLIDILIDSFGTLQWISLAVHTAVIKI